MVASALTSFVLDPVLDKILWSMLPLFAGGLIAVASSFFSRRQEDASEHKKWLREQRYELCVEISEAANQLVWSREGAWNADEDPASLARHKTLSDEALNKAPSLFARAELLLDSEAVDAVTNMFTAASVDLDRFPDAVTLALDHMRRSIKIKDSRGLARPASA